MSRKTKHTEEQRIKAVEEYINGEGSYEKIAKKYGMGTTTLQDYVRRAKAEGIDKLHISSKNKKYSETTKLLAVKEYLESNISKRAICTKYKISDAKTLRMWIMWYNNGKDFKEHSSERGVTMSNGRKTTLEERTEIVAFCIANGKDYRAAAEKYGVSYQQVYSWVHKYEARGTDGLTDRRGKAKPESELTEADKLRMENKILQAKLKDQEIEIAILKKLRELRGGGQ